jgi:hypothetical protein
VIGLRIVFGCVRAVRLCFETWGIARRRGTLERSTTWPTKESSDKTQGVDDEISSESKADLGRPAEADAQQNKAPTEVGPVTEEKKRRRRC